ncbi:dihydroneopterin aldolase [Deinococcus lacus]|uniref:7,8-dihydroneopterin aldolase n=1 Tax=Deinococcus lacus TaxID=392561 RepID=A0ABW1YBB7_9DEIO
MLEGLEFYGRHGLYAAETQLGARFRIDAELFYPYSGIEDDLSLAVNYAEVYASVQAEVTQQRYDLIETLADRLAHRILAEQPLVTRIVLRVHKPHAPLPGIFGNVYTELTLERA